ncbi:hypothetical protein PN419_07960 [Halorubrum ezzemoulense]|uniref:hypothetical protein n=1 Tax=Halorubrum ezzemoulense TaxID=337243 RepID=UPI00232D3128|nr:hypothetical protein [Halorubrum ezzemoulense]MDB9248945.1 hypothetical protein [Halorubrum ezzemoulense]MDB9258717.1 hypothetical protein [Halorubrum ezzemoulense]MDB9262704.1 hypothetical protein [Halorubrum ezzemoulense]MDB9265736.1 hypothetical protein [Halorubrum ezzemoulense]MDB9269078.1 hypothetical protein [Halorubrum ezzemoulense]
MKPTAQALARTYSDREYPDPWEKLLDYRRVQEYAAEHPNHGRTRVGKALDLPLSRVRGWISNGMPDSVRGIQTAIDRGWLGPDPEGETAAALVELLAHVLAGGSITSQTYVPSVTTGRRVDLDDVQSVFDRIGVESVVRRANDSGRATEVLPEPDRSVLGRCLVTMGAPAGEKVNLDEFPLVVWDVPTAARESFARIYVNHHAREYSEKRTLVVQEKRSQTYLEGLSEFLTDVTGESVTVSGHNVTISADAARALCLA